MLFRIGDHTGTLIVLLSMLGSLWVAGIVLSMRFRARWVVLAGVAGFIAAQLVTLMGFLVRDELETEGTTSNGNG